MPATQQITDPVIHDSIVRAVGNVCRTMIRKEVRFVDKTDDPTRINFTGSSHVFGNVGFVGNINGVVYLCLTDDFAVFAASEILGLSPAEIASEGPETLKDVIGEITNMTVGGFKNALCDIGYPCKLTLPTIVRGDNLQVSSVKGATRHIFSFECSSHRFVADIQIKAD